MSTPDPFAYQGPLMPSGSGLSQQMSGWGGMPAANTGMENLSYLDQMMARQYESQIGLNERQGAAFDRMGQAPSKWATGAQTFGNITQGLAGLGNIYLGLKGLKQQKEAFKFNKEITNTNMDNSIKDYNRRLGDTLANRALNNGQGQGWVSSELAKYSAKRSGG